MMGEFTENIQAQIGYDIQEMPQSTIYKAKWSVTEGVEATTLASVRENWHMKKQQ